MDQNQFHQWIHHTSQEHQPRVFVLGGADLSQYSIAVEYRHTMEPLRNEKGVIHFQSLDKAKNHLRQQGVSHAYLRLFTPYEECGAPGGQRYSDMELPLTDF